MNKLFIFILLLQLPVLVRAQEAGSFVSINTGVSFPLGSYAGTALYQSSFAQPGWNIDMEGGWFFYKGIGAGIEAGYFAHPVDVGSLASEKIAADPFLEALVIRSDPYRVITLAGFVHYSLQILQHLSFVPKAGAGIAYGSSPYQLHKASYYLIGTRWYEITSTSDWTGYYSAGASLRYNLNDCVELMINTEFGYGKLKYQFMTGTGEIREEVHQMMTLDVLAGIAIRF